MSRRIVWINFSYSGWCSCNEKKFGSMITSNYFNSGAKDYASFPEDSMGAKIVVGEKTIQSLLWKQSRSGIIKKSVWHKEW